MPRDARTLAYSHVVSVEWRSLWLLHSSPTSTCSNHHHKNTHSHYSTHNCRPQPLGAKVAKITVTLKTRENEDWHSYRCSIAQTRKRHPLIGQRVTALTSQESCTATPNSEKKPGKCWLGLSHLRLPNSTSKTKHASIHIINQYISIKSGSTWAMNCCCQHVHAHTFAGALQLLNCGASSAIHVNSAW